MKIYIAHVSGNWGFTGCDRNETIEFEMEDDSTAEEVEKEAQKLCWEWFCEYADCSAYDITLKSK